MPVSQYELTNLSVNTTTDQGDQQISVRPYHEVTSLNANQLLNDVVAHGPSRQKVEFEQGDNDDQLRVRVKKGFVGHFIDYVEHDVDGEGNIQRRTYAVKVAFDDDATVTSSVANLRSGGGTEFRSEDNQDQLGVPNPSHQRVSLVLQYNWEEGMLGSAVAAGGGTTGSRAVGSFANLRVIAFTPQRLKTLIENQFKKTLFLGEIINLQNAIETVGGEDIIHPERVQFRPYRFDTYESFTNLRKSNDNFKVTFNPTGDWCYVNPGSAYIGSALVTIPEGLSWRTRAVVPMGLRDAIQGDPELRTNILDSSVNFNSAGNVVDSEGNYFSPPEEDEDVAGQLDILVMNQDGEIGWIVRPYTLGQETMWDKPLQFAEDMGDLVSERNLPQTPGWDFDDEDIHIDNTLSVIRAELDDRYLVLLIVKRPYYDDAGDLKLNSSIWPHYSQASRDWIIYEHNPLFPILSVPDIIKVAEITDLLIIPIQED